MSDQQANQPGAELSSTLEMLAAAVDQLSQSQDLATVQEVVSRSARQLTGADGATFVLRDGKQARHVEEDAVGPLWKGQSFPIEECISGWAMLYRQPVAVSDIRLDDRIRLETYESTFVKSLAMVPIRSVAPMGAIGAYWESTHSASHTEISILQSLADATAVVLANPALGQFAIHDQVSGLFNRRGFFSRGGGRTVDNWDQGEGTIVLFASLEGVDAISRKLGRQVGDEAIRQAGIALRKVCGEYAVIGRVEEDAFAACESSSLLVTHDADDLETAIRDAMPDADLPVEVTVGVALTEAGDHVDLDTLVAKANSAMYERRHGQVQSSAHRAARSASRA